MKKNFLTKLLFFVFLIMIFNSNLVHAEEDIKIPENYIEKPENIENIENHLNTLIQVENGNAKVFNNEEAIEENDLLVFFDIEGKKYYIFNEQMINEMEYNNLCKLVHAEAENQDLKGKILIVNVVLNRVEDERFDDNINDVIFSPGQFSPAGKSYFKNIEPTEEDIKAVKEALNGTDYSEGALYFKKAKDESDWGSLECLFKHEDHGFYK